MKKSVALIAGVILTGTSVMALAQAPPAMSQAQKDEMARKNPIPGNKAAGGSTPIAPNTANPGASQTTGAAGGAGGAAGAGAAGAAGSGAGGGAGAGGAGGGGR